YLDKNQLLVSRKNQEKKTSGDIPFYQKIIHNYLYFTIPLFHPQNFLERTVDYVAPFLSSGMTKIMMVALLILSFITFGRWEEFARTFHEQTALDSMVYVAMTFAFIKIIHEWAHAYTATKYKVPVPHMGIAFIVLYPILYTETTASWKLKNKYERMAIGLAGVRAELFLATIFLLLWHAAPTGGILQTLSFYGVAVSLISSVLVNLNPLMRFDGYYILSDWIGIENLQTRACAFARVSLRNTIFGIGEHHPELLSSSRARFLTFFGYALLIYRFFLFTGIAILVYHMVFQPLGIVLAAIELWFFILKPILGELKIWKSNVRKILASWRARWVFGISLAVMSITCLPISNSVTSSSIISAKNLWSAYLPNAAILTEKFVEEGGAVKKDQPLMAFISPELETEEKLVQNQIVKLQAMKRQKSAGQSNEESNELDNQLSIAVTRLKNIQEQKNNLLIKAPFNGTVTDMMEGVRTGRTFSSRDKLFSVVEEGNQTLTTYISERDVARIKEGSRGEFIHSVNPLLSREWRVHSIESVSPESITIPELIPHITGRKSHGQAALSPSESLYKVILHESASTDKKGVIRQHGIIRISAESRIPAWEAMKSLLGLLRREISLY
ncbi:MAG: efflux RND transporter periplasmic adaptor subunit, partial [Alphaproteobacteria bacterium]|nr:efflux RND transporter periplasmic adaptor subunit [Alphaproteobacteria bacterium]